MPGGLEVYRTLEPHGAARIADSCRSEPHGRASAERCAGTGSIGKFSLADFFRSFDSDDDASARCRCCRCIVNGQPGSVVVFHHGQNSGAPRLTQRFVFRFVASRGRPTSSRRPLPPGASPCNHFLGLLSGVLLQGAGSSRPASRSNKLISATAAAAAGSRCRG